MSGLMRIVCASQRLSTRAFSTTATHRGAGGLPAFDDPPEKLNPAIGKREILAFGYDGDPAHYYDYPHFPAQSVRFREDTDHVTNVLRPKEKGDWREMTIEEKKTLYRTAYNQTVSEFVNQHKNRWKIDVNYNLMLLWMTMAWLFICQTSKVLDEGSHFDRFEAVVSDAIISNPAFASNGTFDPETGEWKILPWYDVYV